MNNEILDGTKSFLALLGPLVASFCSMLGGRDVDALGIRARIWKRVIAPSANMAFMLLISFMAHTLNWWLFTLLIWYIPVGYGGDKLWVKLLRRTISSFFFALPCILICIHTGKWPVAICQVIIGVSSSIILGVTNPVKASQEEEFIYFSNTFLTGYALL